MTGERVLLIGGRAHDTAFLVEEVLNPDGYRVLRAKGRGDSVHQATVAHPDLIIMDLDTDAVPGFDVLEELAAREVAVPVIVVSALRSEEVIVRALRLGVVDYVFKPFSPEEMRAAINRALAVGRTRVLARGVEQVNSQLERKVKELGILYGIGKAVTSVLDLEKLLNRIVEAAVYLADAEEGFLLLVDEETNELYMRAGQGLGEKFAQGFRVKVEDSLSGQVIKTGKPIMVSAEDSEYKLKTGYLVKSFLHVPIKVRDRTIGLLSVDNRISRKSFTEHDLYLLSALADYGAIAIENARLYQKADAEARQLSQLLAERDRIELEHQEEIARLTHEVQTQREAVVQGLQEAEQLAQELQAQAVLAEQLAERLRAHQMQAGELARRLSQPQPAALSLEGAVPGVGRKGLRPVLDSLDEGVLIADEQGRVVLVNATAARFLGDAVAELMGRDLRTVCGDEHWDAALDRLQAEETSQEVTLWLEDYVIRADMSVLREEDGTRTGTVVVLRDVTRQAEAQRLVDELRVTVSQELRSPMTTINSYADLLLAESIGILGGAQRTLLQRIKDSVHTMNSLLNELLIPQPVAAGRPGAGLVAEVAALVDQVARQVADDHREKGITLTRAIAADLPPLAADVEIVRHVLVGLLENAYRCTPAGGTVTVAAQTQVREDVPHVVISVRDQGGGIPAEELGRVFNRYRRDAERVIPGVGSTGAELAIVRALAEVCGGRVWAESEPGVGSTLSVILPTHQVK
ncbi:MAG: GAF domain-containing protein [Anaerolineae bacterium]|nr:GAF domain-containing protein [Anaerolineae bacterium]